MHTILCLLAVLLTHTTWSAYILDDSNQTVEYSPHDRWWTVPCSDCYGGTETYNPYGCNTTDNCHLVFPFTGTGVTLYMTFVYASYFNVSIDSSTPTQYTLFRNGSPALYNFVAYDRQSLPFGHHVLDLVQLDTNESVAHNSNFLFDYAVINDTAPFMDVKSSSAPGAAMSSSSALAPQSKKKNVAGAIAGGVVAGLILLASLCSLLFFYCRKPPSPDDLPFDSGFMTTEANRYPYPQGSFNPDALQNLSKNGPAVTTTLQQQHPSAVVPAFKPPASGQPPLPVLPYHSSTSAAPPSLSPPAPLPQVRADRPAVATTTLSDDQLNLLRHLSDSNAPGPVLAAVVESMVHGPRDGIQSHRPEPVGSPPPPDYKSAAG